MYDVSAEFNKFYRDKVVLCSSDQHELREKKKLNVGRLKSGLQEYNKKRNQLQNLRGSCAGQHGDAHSRTRR